MIVISAIFSIFFLELSLLIITSLFLIDIFKKKILVFNVFSKVFIIFYLYLIVDYFLQIILLMNLSIFFYFRYFLYVIAIFIF